MGGGVNVVRDPTTEEMDVCWRILIPMRKEYIAKNWPTPLPPAKGKRRPLNRKRSKSKARGNA